MQHSLFDGRVLFHIRGYRSIKSEIILDHFRRAIPEHATMPQDGTAYDAFATCALVLGCTDAIEFSGETSEVIDGLWAFWDLARVVKDDWGSADYRALFDAYTRLLTPEIHAAWWQFYAASIDASASHNAPVTEPPPTVSVEPKPKRPPAKKATA